MQNCNHDSYSFEGMEQALEVHLAVEDQLVTILDGTTIVIIQWCASAVCV